MKISSIWIPGFILLFLACPALQAQETMETPVEVQDVNMEAMEEMEDVEDAEDTLITFGSVEAVTETGIDILEYDFEKDEEVKAAFRVDEQTQFDGVASLSEIQPGMAVEVYYVLEGEGRLAVLIAKDELEEMEGEDMESGSEQEPSLDESTIEQPDAVTP